MYRCDKTDDVNDAKELLMIVYQHEAAGDEYTHHSDWLMIIAREGTF